MPSCSGQIGRRRVHHHLCTMHSQATNPGCLIVCFGSGSTCHLGVPILPFRSDHISLSLSGVAPVMPFVPMVPLTGRGIQTLTGLREINFPAG